MAYKSGRQSFHTPASKWGHIGTGTYETADRQYQARYNSATNEWMLLVRDDNAIGNWTWAQSFPLLRDVKAAVKSLEANPRKKNPGGAAGKWYAVACKGGEVWYLRTSEAFDYWVTDQSQASRFARQDTAAQAARNEHRFRHGVGRGWMVGGVPVAWTRERILQECAGRVGNPAKSKARASKVKKRAKKKTAKRNPVRRWIAYKTNGRSVRYAGSGKLMPLAWVGRRRDAKVWSAERTANTALKSLRDIEKPAKGWVYGVTASSASANDIKRVKGGGKRSTNPGPAAGLWFVFRCLGESVRFMTIRRGRVAWTDTAQDAVRFNYKSQAASEAHIAGQGAGNQGWQFGAAPESITAQDIRRQCAGGAAPGKP